MAYTIIKTNGTVLTTIADGTVNNTSSSLELPGRNYAGYGVVMDTNLVHLLENFADYVVPSNPLKGQLWYNTNDTSLYVCPSDGETNPNNWVKLLSTLNGDLSLGNLSLSDNLVANNAFLTNDITANSITTNYLTVNQNANLLGTSTIPNIVANTITAGITTGTINGNWTINGNIAPTGIKTNNYYYANGVPIDFQQPAGANYQLQYSLDGNFGASSNLTFDPTSNVLTVVGDVDATNLIGDGSNLTNLPAGNLTGTIPLTVQNNITSTGTLGNLTVTSNISSGNLTATGNISATRLTGSLTTPAQPNITSIGTLTDLTSSGNIDFQLSSNVKLGQVANLKILGGTNGYLLQTNGSGDVSFVNPLALSTGASGSNTYIQYNNNGVFGSSANFTFDSGTNILQVNGNINSNNANLGNAVTANYFIGSGYNLSNLRGSNVISQVPNALISGTVYTNAQPNITSVGTLVNLAVTGNVNAGNVIATHYGSGAGLTNIPGGNVIGTVPSATTATTAGSATTATTSVTAGTVTTGAQPNITSVGTLTSLNVTGNITAGGNISASYYLGNGSLLTGIGASNTALTVTNNAQPNITSVGTLTSLTVSGTINSGNASLGNTATASFFVGNGYQLTSITGANVTGTVANATYATVANSVAGANVSGAVAYATTANSVAGANVSGTVANATYAVTAGATTTAGTVTTNAQPNITSVGILSNLTVSGLITASSGNSAYKGISFPDPESEGEIAYIRYSNPSESGLLEIGIIDDNEGYQIKLTSSGGVTATGNITAPNFIGNVQNAIGYYQTWQNVTTSRLIGSTYTNNTGKPIQVSISIYTSSNNYADAYFYVNGVKVWIASFGGSTGTRTYNCQVIIPPGATYQMTGGWSSTGYTQLWCELR